MVVQVELQVLQVWQDPGWPEKEQVVLLMEQQAWLRRVWVQMPEKVRVPQQRALRVRNKPTGQVVTQRIQ